MAIVRYTLVRKDGEIASEQDPHGGSQLGKWLLRSPKIEIDSNGERWAILGNGRYHITGRSSWFYYRLWRSLFMAKHIGFQHVWLEGHPEQFDFDEEVRRKHEHITAEAITNMSHARRTAEGFFRPRKVDWIIILLVALAAFAIGTALGGRLT